MLMSAMTGKMNFTKAVLVAAEGVTYVHYYLYNNNQINILKD
jgi:hypothetical protein